MGRSFQFKRAVKAILEEKRKNQRKSTNIFNLSKNLLFVNDKKAKFFYKNKIDLENVKYKFELAEYLSTIDELD
jgi:hypothetical protein